MQTLTRWNQRASRMNSIARIVLQVFRFHFHPLSEESIRGEQTLATLL